MEILGYDVEVSTRFEDFLAMEAEWDALWEESEAGMPMTAHLLYRCWWEAYGAGQELVMAAAREEGRLVAAVLLRRKRRGPPYWPVRLLRGFEPWHTDQRHGILHRRGKSDAALALVLGLRQAPGWDGIVIGKLDVRWEQYEALRRGLPMSVAHAHRGIARIRIQSDFETFFASRPGSLRRNLRRRAREIEEKGGFTFECLRGAEVDASVFARMMEVDRESWKKETIIGVAAPSRLEFFRRFIEAASSHGWSRLYLARHDGRDVAFTFLLDAGGIATLYKMSYVEEFARFHLGAALLKRAIEDTFRSGHEIFDFFNHPVGDLQRLWYNELLPQAEVLTFDRSVTGISVWLGRLVWERFRKQPPAEAPHG